MLLSKCDFTQSMVSETQTGTHWESYRGTNGSTEEKPHTENQWEWTEWTGDVLDTLRRVHVSE